MSVAPMMALTDRHFRFMARLISRNVLLYTEMVTAASLVRGGAVHQLEFSDEEQPLALQLGGSDPAELARACEISTPYGYREINLNVGCPSDRVQSGAFGAVLMKDPALVARCVRAMMSACDAEITVKCRIGVDEQDPRAVLPHFLEMLQEAGVRRVTIHARKAWLNGLSPKENRTIPPLDWPLVTEMKARFPECHISLNGGVDSLDQARDSLDEVDGVMIGRAAYHDPYGLLAEADARIYGDARPVPTREEVAQSMVAYTSRHVAAGGRSGDVTRHMLGLFTSQRGARQWRRLLSSNPTGGASVIEDALEQIRVPATA